MKTYRFYAHPQGLEHGFDCVKQGFSWPAFIFGVFWLLYCRLWVAVILYFFYVSVALSLAGLALDRWAPQGRDGLMGGLEWAVVCAAHVLLGFVGNALRERKLLRQGYTLASSVQAASPDAEIKRLSA